MASAISSSTTTAAPTATGSRLKRSQTEAQ